MKQVRSKISAIVEVAAIFFLIVVLFQSIRISNLSQWETEILSGQRSLFLEYGAVLGIVIALLAITGRDRQKYGLTLKDGKLQARVIVIGLPPVFALSGTLGLVDWRTWIGAGLVSLVAIGAVFGLGWALRGKGTAPGLMMALALGASVPCGVEIGPVSKALIKTAYFYLLAGPAEEMLFRGYIQSRLNETLGKPYRFFGVKWGWGLVLASVFFGLWHVVWRPLDGGAWLHGMWTFFAGLIFGYVREKSNSVVAASVLHSVMNYVPLFDLIGV